MNPSLHFKASLVAASFLLLPMAQAASMTKDEHKAAKATIATTYKTDKAACTSMVGNAKDICTETAKGKEKVAAAELEYGYTSKAGDRNKIAVAQADATYAVAKERCDDLAGNPKDVCVKEAKAVHVKALADAKLGKTVGEARQDATTAKRDADYKVATEKCDALAGEAKTSCMASAKSAFGKG